MDRAIHDQLANFADTNVWENPHCGPDSDEKSFLDGDFNEWIHEFIRQEALVQGKTVFGLTEAYALAVEGWGAVLGERFLVKCIRHSIQELDGQTLEFTHLPVQIQKHALNQLRFMNV